MLEPWFTWAALRYAIISNLEVVDAIDIYIEQVFHIHCVNVPFHSIKAVS